MKGILAWCAAIAMLSAFGGCQKDGATGPGVASGNGTLVIRLTDAPAAYEAVNIAVDSVCVHVDSADSLSGWHTISRSPAMYDLLQYTGGRDTIIAEGDIPAGYYSQLRLYVGAGSNVVVDGVTHDLEIPSGSQSGLKLNIQAAIAEGVKYVLVLDFDASRSIVVTGNTRFQLKPVIKTLATAVSGSITGAVVPASATPTIWVIAGADTSSTIADTTGLFQFNYLVPAMYSVKIVPGDPTYREMTLTNVNVFTGLKTEVGPIVLQPK